MTGNRRRSMVVMASTLLQISSERRQITLQNTRLDLFLTILAQAIDMFGKPVCIYRPKKEATVALLRFSGVTIVLVPFLSSQRFYPFQAYTLCVMRVWWRMISSSPRAWTFSQVLFGVGAWITVFGMACAVYALRIQPQAGWLAVATVCLTICAIAWTWTLYQRIVDPVAFANGSLLGFPFALYTVLTIATLAIAGVALLQIGFGSWSAWILITGSFLLLALYVLFGHAAFRTLPSRYRAWNFAHPCRLTATAADSHPFANPTMKAIEVRKTINQPRPQGCPPCPHHARAVYRALSYAEAAERWLLWLRTAATMAGTASTLCAQLSRTIWRGRNNKCAPGWRIWVPRSAGSSTRGHA